MKRGEFVIVGMFLIAIGLSVFAVVYLRTLRTEAVAFWGATVALSIRDAPDVELLVLQEGASAGPELPRIADGSLAVRTSRTINGAPGLLQMRSMLLDNATFRFDVEAPADVQWKRGFRFTGPKHQTTTLLFDTEKGRLWHLESDRQVDVKPQSDFLSHFLDDVSNGP